MSPSRRRALTRRALVAAVAATLLALPPGMARADDALAFAQSLYALPNLWEDVTADAPAIAKYLDANLGNLITVNYAMTDPDAALDYDPLVQAQDFENVQTSFTVDQETDTGAVITVAVVNFDEHTTVTLDLAMTADGWRLSNVLGPDGPGLVDELKQLNATTGSGD
jgi:hypothetical protein